MIRTIQNFRKLLDTNPHYEEKRDFIDWASLKYAHELAAYICFGINCLMDDEATLKDAYEECSDDPRHWAQHFCRKPNEPLIRYMDEAEKALKGEKE